MLMKRLAPLFLLLLLGCSNQPKPVDIRIILTDSNRNLKITGFDKAIIAEIGRDTANGAWQSLLPVYKMPADTDMKDFQPAQPGQYHVADSVVIFTPDTLFKKGQSYFLRYYMHQEHEDAWHYLRDKKRPGALSYKDLIFSY
jgi:hypothetical protein